MVAKQLTLITMSIPDSSAQHNVETSKVVSPTLPKTTFTTSPIVPKVVSPTPAPVAVKPAPLAPTVKVEPLAPKSLPDKGDYPHYNSRAGLKG